MARTHWRVTHHPVALVCSAAGAITLLAVGRDIPFLGGLRVTAGASCLLSQGLDLPALSALEAAFQREPD